MNYNEINIDLITLLPNSDNYDVKYNNNKLKFFTPIINIPFGLENEYKNLFLKMEFNKNTENIKFLEIIKQIENKFNSILPCPLKSELRDDHKIISVIKDKEHNYYNIYNISRNQQIIGEIYIDKIWKYNDKFYYKWNYNKININ